MTYSERGSYEGKWRKQLRHGKGFFEFNDGSRYDGFFKKDKRHGIGRYTKEVPVHEYTGRWKDDVYHGFGELLTQQRFYTGKFVKGEFFKGDVVNHDETERF